MALLELRLIALASAVKKEGSAEIQEKPPSKEVTSNRKETPRKTSRGNERSTTRTSSGTNRQSRQDVKLPKISYYVEKFRSGENHELRSIV